MLRHRVIQQCARLALGIATPDNLPKANRLIEKESNQNKNERIQQISQKELSRTNILKQKLDTKQIEGSKGL